VEKGLVADCARRTDEAVVKKEWAIERWARDLSYRESLERLVGRPTVNIQGLVSGYDGPGGKTILPHRALAKLDIRLVPDMDGRQVLGALKAHLEKRGFGDIEVRDLGSYNPTTTAFNSLPVQAGLAAYRKWGLEPLVFPRSGGSWPGYLFTEKPLRLPAAGFGLGYGFGAHSKDEYYVIESATPKIQGIAGATRSYVDFVYAFAAA
jgi:acetylornithine deacetylase/succinyl-diaminopimelate desuccinylase-like protein